MKKPVKQLVYELRRWVHAPNAVSAQDIMDEAANRLEELAHDSDKFWRMAERCKENYMAATKENAQFRKAQYNQPALIRLDALQVADLNKLIELHNDARAKKSWFRPLRALTKSVALTEYAQSHAFKMADGGWLRHSSMDNVLKLGFTAAGENIAWGQSSEESVLNSWLWSYGHRANILSSKYDSIGCDARKDKAGRLYWCVVFGKLKPQSAS